MGSLGGVYEFTNVVYGVDGAAGFALHGLVVVRRAVEDELTYRRARCALYDVAYGQ